MKRIFSTITRLGRRFRNSEIGQCLIVLAMGLIVLAIITMVAYAFVGG